MAVDTAPKSATNYTKLLANYTSVAMVVTATVTGQTGRGGH